MILTVTCNPALDLTYVVDRFVPGDVHRVRTVRQRPGGKGVNVARVLHQLGEPVTALGLGDREFGAAVEELGLPATFLDVLPAVRRTVVVTAPSSTTSLWEPGTTAPDSASGSLAALVAERLAGAAALVVSGSLPPGVDPALPAVLADLAAHADVPCILDLDDAALEMALAHDGVLTPNRDELARLVGAEADADLAVTARALARRNRAPVVLTLGAHGLLATVDGECWHARLPTAVRGNATGAGDATAAGLACGLARREAWPEVLSRAAALGAAAVLAPVAGEVDLPAYHAFAAQVLVRQVDTLTIGATV